MSGPEKSGAGGNAPGEILEGTVALPGTRRALCRLRPREAGGIFVQATGVLPLVRRAAHGRERRGPSR